MELLENQGLYARDEKNNKGGCIEVRQDSLQELNDRGWAIYFSVNGFRAVTPEEHERNGTNQRRCERYLSHLHFCYGDLDIAKESESKTQKEKDELKDIALQAVMDWCRPSKIIWTKNGIQPLWHVDCKVEDLELYKLVNQGIVEWSKKYNCLADNVYDAARLLRFPDYMHNKGAPYKCEIVVETDATYTLTELLEKFPAKPKTQKQKEFFNLTVEEVITEAAKRSGIVVTFNRNADGSKQIVENGEKTSGFISARGNFCYSNSGKDRKGGVIQVAAYYLGTDYNAATQWVMDTFGVRAKAMTAMPFLEMKEMVRETIAYHKTIDPKRIFSYGYESFDAHLGGIYESELILIGGEAKTGKTSFLTNILKHNAKNHPVVFFCLEDTLREYTFKQLWFEIGKIRKSEGKNNYPWVEYRNNKIKDFAFEKYRSLAGEILSEESANLQFYDMNHEAAPDMMDVETLEVQIRRKAAMGVRLFGIDHLHFLNNFVSRDSKADRIEEIMKRIKLIADKNNVAIILLAHYRKLNGQKPTLDSFKDSASIVQVPNVVINIWRDRSEADLDGKKFETHFMLPAVRNPNGEATIIMEFDNQTFAYKPVSSHRGTEQSSSFSTF